MRNIGLRTRSYTDDSSKSQSTLSKIEFMIWERVQYSCLSEKALISAKALVDRRIDVGLEFGFIRLFFLGGLQIIRIKLKMP